MASMSTLTDNFDDNSLSASWTAEQGTTATTAETNNEIEQTSSLLADSTNLSSANTYDLSGSYAIINLKDSGDLTKSIYRLWFIVKKSATERLEFKLNSSGSQNIEAYSDDAEDNVLGTATYNSSTHAWLRIREASGTIYWDISSNGTTWTNFANQTNPFAITAVRIELRQETNDTSLSTTTAKWDNFNLPPTGTNAQINIGDAWKAVPAVQINIGDVWKSVAGIKINIGDVWKTIF